MLHMKAKPIIPWIGGKRRLAKKIIPLLPPHGCYVEPFAGGAAILFLKDPSEAEVLNDINGDLVNLYRVVTHHLEEFVRQFRWALISREGYEMLNRSGTDGMTDIQRAARFYYLQKLAFGGKVESRTFGTSTTTQPRLNLLRIEEELSAAHIRLCRVTIENLPWRELMTRYDRPHTLFYCDPPYYGTEGYGVEFGLENYFDLANMAKTMAGNVLISVNDIPEMREAFMDLPQQSVSITYTVGGGGRSASASELIVSNF